jgi:hypothetical protein
MKHFEYGLWLSMNCAVLAGKLCETYISKCDPSPCKNNGICTEDGTNYQCKCDEKYYYGDRCQLLQQNCAPDRDPCNKNGTELDGCEGEVTVVHNRSQLRSLVENILHFNDFNRRPGTTACDMSMQTGLHGFKM